jgi:Dolichyl-phosphate-mannose-protein mannosyltransferase
VTAAGGVLEPIGRGRHRKSRRPTTALAAAQLHHGWWRPLCAALGRSPWPLPLVLVAQAGLSLRLVWHNTAFQDEALYLWAGRVELSGWLHGTPIPDFALLFSGAPVVYPPLGALADSLGGLTAARLLSLFFMLCSTALLFAVTKQFFGRRAAFGAAGLFAVLGPVQVLGAFATYDAMAIFLLALATWCAIRTQSRLSELWLAAAALAMALADACKYASLLWNPVIICVAGLAMQSHWPRAALRAARATAYTAALVLVALLRSGGPSYVQGVLSTTLLRHAGDQYASAELVLHDSFDWVGIVLVLAVGGAVAAFRCEGNRIRLLALVLTTAIVLAPADQARIHVLTSLHKHVAFGAWFAAIVAGYAVSRLIEIWRVREWLVVVVAAAAALAGTPQANSIFHGWPDASGMIAALRPIMRASACPCLISENRVVSYYLPNQTAGAKLTDPYQFSYWSQARHEDLHGLPAYESAIASHYFGVVELDADEEKPLYRPVLDAVESVHGYELLKVIPSNIPGKPIIVWRYTGHGGAAPGQREALARDLSFRPRPIPASPLGGILTPPAILRPFLGDITAGLLGSGVLVLALALIIRFGWRRGKAVGEP